MPYKKSYKKPYKKQYKSDGTQALKLVKKLAKEMKPEMKTLAYNQTLQPTVNGIVQDFGSLVAVGTANNQRVGDTVRWRHLTLRGYASVHPMSVIGDFQMSRIIVFIDKCGDINTCAALLRAVGSAYAPLSAYNEGSKENFTILHDRMFSQIRGSDSQLEHYRIEIPLNYQCTYEGSTNVVNTNDIKVAVINQVATAGTGSVFVQQADLSFTDV